MAKLPPVLGAAGRRPRRAILPAPGSRAGAQKKRGQTYAPPPFVPSARKTFFLRRSPLKSRRRLSQKKKFCKVRPLRPPLRRPQHDAGFIWPVRYQSGGCFIVLHGALSGRSDIRAAGSFIVLHGAIFGRSDTIPPTHHKRCCSTLCRTCQGYGRKAPRRKRRP